LVVGAKTNFKTGRKKMKTLTSKLQKGCRIYYTGDMANDEGFGTITNVKTSKWGTSYDIAYDDGRNTNIDKCAFSDEYLGHGGTRFVTLEAYNKFKRLQFLRVGYSSQKVYSGKYDHA
jgi:hypothetical protein